jgi:hypothetical protein
VTGQKSMYIFSDFLHVLSKFKKSPEILTNEFLVYFDAENSNLSSLSLYLAQKTHKIVLNLVKA